MITCVYPLLFPQCLISLEQESLSLSLVRYQVAIHSYYRIEILLLRVPVTLPYYIKLKGKKVNLAHV